MSSVRTWLRGAVASAGLLAVIAAAPGVANASPILGTAAVALTGTVTITGPDLSNPGSITVPGLFVTSATGTFTSVLGASQGGFTLDSGALNTFVFGDGTTPIDFTATASQVIVKDPRHFSVNFLGTGSEAGGFDDAPASLAIAFTETSGTVSGSFTLASPAAFTVPEPAAIVLFGTGLLGLGLIRRRSA